jgi:hypothetical protein
MGDRLKTGPLLHTLRLLDVMARGILSAPPVRLRKTIG